MQLLRCKESATIKLTWPLDVAAFHNLHILRKEHYHYRVTRGKEIIFVKHKVNELLPLSFSRNFANECYKIKIFYVATVSTYNHTKRFSRCNFSLLCEIHHSAGVEYVSVLADVTYHNNVI